MPGGGEHPGLKEGQPLGTPLTSKVEASAVATPVQNETTKMTTTCGTSGEKHRPGVLLEATATTCGSSEKLRRSDDALVAVPPQLLTVAGAQSASVSQVTGWATTRCLVQALLAAACRRTEARPRQAAQGEGAWASGTEARLVACSLLSRVCFGLGEDDRAGGLLDEGETSLLLDQWYEGFCDAAASLGEGRGSCLKETPRLLLEGMLSVPAVRTGFVQRGLVRHLTEGLRVSWRRYHGWLSSSPPGGGACRSAEPPQRTDDRDGLVEDDPRNDAGQYIALADGLRAKTHLYSDPSLSQRAGFLHVPWWLFTLGSWTGLKPTGDDTHGGGGGEAGSSAVGGGARESAELAESSKTASEKGFTSGEEDHEDENISPITQGYDNTTDDGRRNGDNSLAFTVSALPSQAGENVPDRGREGGRGRERGEGGEGAGGGSSRERIAPPRLRLDALDSILSNKEWASPRLCSPHAAVTLSAASTRASAHLVSFQGCRHVGRGLLLHCSLLLEMRKYRQCC